LTQGDRSVATRTSRNQGKTAFVQQFLQENPLGNVSAVNEAWKASGRKGTISGTLVNKMRSQLGLAGNLRGRPRKQTAKASDGPDATGQRRGRKPRSSPVEAETPQPTARVETRGRKSARSKALVDLESEIDRLLFKVMGMGEMTDIEDGLREARRLLYAAQGS
jgi:hypothetical protein